MKSRLIFAGVAVAAVLAAVGFSGGGVGAVGAPVPVVGPRTQCAPGANYPAGSGAVAFWSTEARCAVVPVGPGGVFGVENWYGNKFPGDAAVYMGIVQVAIYDAAVSIVGGYRPYAATPVAPAGTSPEAAIAAAAYTTLSGLQPQLGASQAILDADYAAYLGAIPDGKAKADGIAVGEQVARAGVVALRQASTTAGGVPPPRPISASPPRGLGSGNPGPARCWDCVCPGRGRWVCAVPASSGPAVPTP